MATTDTAGPAVRAPGLGMALAGMCSVQFGAALAATLFPALGPLGVVTLRMFGAAVALCALARPRLRGRTRAEWTGAIALGTVTAVMNISVYQAIGRLPLGAAITYEFLGPLCLAVLLSRRARDLLWAVCAGVGVLLLGGSLTPFDPVGVAFGLAGAGCWAGYILLNQRLGTRHSGLDGLALAAVVSAVLVIPVGGAQLGPVLDRPSLLGLGALVGVLSSAVPYSLDLLALRRLPARVFSVLMSLAPALAALAGWLVLGQPLTLTRALAIVLVVVAGIGATSGSRQTKPQRPDREELPDPVGAS